MNRKQVLRIISPGIGLKLSFFTVLLIILIVTVTSVINYNQQKTALSEKLDSEIKIPLEFVNSVVLDIENLNRSLVLIEEFKIRVKEKKKELTKFKRIIVKQETGFLGTLKDLGKSIGLNLKKKSIYSSVDTYFSRYLSEKEIIDFELKVRNQLKKESGAPIDELTFKKIKSLAERTAIEKLNVEKNEVRTNELAGLVSFFKIESAKDQLTEPERKEINQKINSLSIENKQLEKISLNSKKKVLIYESALTRALQTFFRGSFQDQISTLGLSPDKIRIISYDTFGKETMDTGLLFPNSSQTGKKLLSLMDFIHTQKSFFSDIQHNRIVTKDYSQSYDVVGRQYEVSYRPVFRSPNSAVRAIKIYQSNSKGETSFDRLIETDRKISSEFKDLAAKMKARLVHLRLNSKSKPSADMEFKSLAQLYHRLLEKREKAFNELTPAKKDLDLHLENWKKELAAQKAQLQKTESEISLWQNKLKIKPELNDKAIDPEEIQARLQSLDSLAEEQRDTILLLESSKDDISNINNQELDDSYRMLRESTLQDFAFVPFRASSTQIERYYKNLAVRKMESLKFRFLRDWILSGNSETELPKFRGESIFNDTGILVRSRSEAEEMMWTLDSTPLIQSKNESRGLLYEILEKDLLGYNLIIIDRTEGLRQIKKNREETIRYVAIVCLIAVVLSYLLAWLFVRKLKLISKKAEEIEKGNLAVIFPPAGYDEVGILSDSLNDMVIGLKEREEMRGELAAAEEIQKRLLPEKLPTSLVSKIEIAAFYKAMVGVGGDYYDFIELSDGKLAFCIGDVSNHGVGPAIIMALFRAQIRSILRRGERNLKKILLEVNANLYEETPDHIFITFFIGIFDPVTSQIEYVSAGHVKPLFYDASKNKIHELPAGGLPLGMDENSFFETTIERRGIILDPGDIFFQYTDGLDEARSKDGGFFGKQRISQLILSNGSKSATELIAELVKEAELHTNENLSKSGVSTLHDDMAMIVIRKKIDETQTIQS